MAVQMVRLWVHSSAARMADQKADLWARLWAHQWVDLRAGPLAVQTAHSLVAQMVGLMVLRLVAR